MGSFLWMSTGSSRSMTPGATRSATGAIQTVAKTLSAALRPHDIACRWGGDEFVVLLPAATPEGIAAVGHRLVHLIRESWIDLGEDVLSFSASVGGTIAERGDSIHSLIERADNQLYLCKHKGRNCFYMDPLCRDVAGSRLQRILSAEGPDRGIAARLHGTGLFARLRASLRGAEDAFRCVDG